MSKDFNFILNRQRLAIHRGEAAARSCCGSAGFTLLEVMVSVAILGIGLLVIIQLFSGGLSLARATGDHTASVLLAREVMAETLLERPLEEGEKSGVTEDGFSWRVVVKPYGEKFDEFNQAMRVLMVIVDVESGEKGIKSYRLTTLKTVSL